MNRLDAHVLVGLASAVLVVATLCVGYRASAEDKGASSGEALYQAHCAACHDHSDVTRAPPKSVLGMMSASSINFALTEGKMTVQGAGLNDTERGQLIRYLTFNHQTVLAQDNWSANMACPADRRAVNLDKPATIGTFGYDLRNTRALTAPQTGLSKAQLSAMELAWAIAIPGGFTMRTQPAIVGATVFLPVADARAVYA